MLTVVDAMRSDAGGVQWGVKHSQGIRWEPTEGMARASMRSMVEGDARKQSHAKGKVRLVKRDIGPLIEVENPYEQARMNAHPEGSD